MLSSVSLRCSRGLTNQLYRWLSTKVVVMVARQEKDRPVLAQLVESRCSRLW